MLRLQKLEVDNVRFELFGEECDLEQYGRVKGLEVVRRDRYLRSRTLLSTIHANLARTLL